MSGLCEFLFCKNCYWKRKIAEIEIMWEKVSLFPCPAVLFLKWLDHVEHTRRRMEFLLLKLSSLIKHEFKDIFQKNDCRLDSENPTKMLFIAFTCREWKPNSLDRYGTNSSTSKTCFVIAMFSHMFIRLLIQNRFHLLLKNFSI